MDPATAYLLIGAAIIAVPAYVITMDLLSAQARQDAYDELRKEKEADERETAAPL